MAKKLFLIDLLEKERLNLEYVESFASICCKNVANIKNLVYSSEDLTEDECQVILDHFKLYKSSTADVKTFFYRYDSALMATLNHLKPAQVRWVPDNHKVDLKMRFKKGNSPWLFYLTYADPVNVSSYLETCHVRGTLKIVPKVTKCDFVCCMDNDKFHRAVVLSVSKDQRTKTMYFMDSGATMTLNHMKIFEVPDAVVDLPAQCMQCVLNDSLDAKDKVLWPSEIGEIFENILSSFELSVSIVAEKGSFPPNFVVDITTCDEQPKNLNDWVSKRLLPELQVLEEGIDVDELLSRLQFDKAFGIFFSVPESSCSEPSSSESSSSESSSSESFIQSLEEAPAAGDQPSQFPRETISDASGQILEYARVFEGDKRAWSHLNEDLNYASTIDTYQDYFGTPIENEVVIVKSSSGLFRRAKVVQLTSPAQIEVFFIDHGYFERVELSCVKNMLRRFKSIPAQAVKADFLFCSPAKPISEASVVLVKVSRVDKVNDEMELTLSVRV